MLLSLARKTFISLLTSAFLPIGDPEILSDILFY